MELTMRWMVRLAIPVVLFSAAFPFFKAAQLVALAEAQNAADAAALAGAGYLLGAPDDESGAKAEAINFAERNQVRGSRAELRPEDIQVDLEAGVVKVKVRGRVLPLPPPVAWLTVSAEAAAEAKGATVSDEAPVVKALRLIN